MEKANLGLLSDGAWSDPPLRSPNPYRREKHGTQEDQRGEIKEVIRYGVTTDLVQKSVDVVMIALNRSAECSPSGVVLCAHRIRRRSHDGVAIGTQIKQAQRDTRNRLDPRPSNVHALPRTQSRDAAG